MILLKKVHLVLCNDFIRKGSFLSKLAVKDLKIWYSGKFKTFLIAIVATLNNVVVQCKLTFLTFGFIRKSWV